MQLPRPPSHSSVHSRVQVRGLACPALPLERTPLLLLVLQQLSQAVLGEATGSLFCDLAAGSAKVEGELRRQHLRAQGAAEELAAANARLSKASVGVALGVARCLS